MQFELVFHRRKVFYQLTSQTKLCQLHIYRYGHQQHPAEPVLVIDMRRYQVQRSIQQ